MDRPGNGEPTAPMTAPVFVTGGTGYIGRLITRQAMVAALVSAVEASPAAGVKIMEVPDIRRAAKILRF